MFNKRLKARVKELELEMRALFLHQGKRDEWIRPGALMGREHRYLMRENERLKAIVAELCDYVYKEE